MAKYNWRRHRVDKYIFSNYFSMGTKVESSIFHILEQQITPLGRTTGNTIETVPVAWLSGDTVYLTTTTDGSGGITLTNFTYNEEAITDMVSDG